MAEKEIADYVIVRELARGLIKELNGVTKSEENISYNFTSSEGNTYLINRYPNKPQNGNNKDSIKLSKKEGSIIADIHDQKLESITETYLDKEANKYELSVKLVLHYVPDTK
jgi:hypothetical protein